MNNEELFDQLIKDKLENISIGQPDNAWTKFSRASMMNEAREKHFFDQAVSRSLSKINAPIIGNEWLAFKNHWDTYAHDVENQFDSQIRNTLQSGRLKPDSRALETLESALAQSNIRNKNLIPSKIVEAILMSIIIALLFMYTPLLQQSNDKSKRLEQKQTIHSEGQYDRAEVEKIPSKKEFSVPQITDLPKEKTSSFEQSYDLKLIVGRKLNQQIPISHSDNDQYFNPDININSAYESGQQNTGLKLDNKKQVYIDKSPNVISLLASNEASEDHNLAIQPEIYNQYKINKLFQIDIQPKSIFASENYPEYQAIPLNLESRKNLLSAIWLGFRFGRAFDMIRTPTYYQDGKLMSTQKVQSTILAFNVEVKNDFVNVETGVSYSYKKFGSEGSQNENAHFVNIPLTIKKDFFSTNRLVPYFKIGPDVTIVAAATYKQFSQSASGLPKGDQLAAPLSGYPDQKREDGIINSGKLSKNSFLGIHGSIGFEAKINNFSKITFDLSQQINPFEKGIGINNHRFSERSVTVGYKKLLFENLY